MTVEQQLQIFGVASFVDTRGYVILLTEIDGTPTAIVKMTPKQAQRWCSHFVSAYVQAAGGLRRGSHNWVIAGTEASP